MARIRIIDEWLRSPVSPPTRRRAVVVVADSWAEQRVLMRAFSGSLDQTRPTITLRDEDLAIGPAGIDPHGSWGIHVEAPADGRAQMLREQLEEAARRLAGARRSPPRLQDEEPASERRPTDVWIAPRARSEGAASPAAPADGQPPPRSQRRSRQTEKLFPVLERDRAGRERPPAPTDPLSDMVSRTMPLGFRLTAAEREVLNALGHRGALAASEIASLAHTGDGAAWMRQFRAKLAEHGLDLVAAGEERDGGPVFRLRR